MERKTIDLTIVILLLIIDNIEPTLAGLGPESQTVVYHRSTLRAQR